jgi:hypothetical protein
MTLLLARLGSQVGINHRPVSNEENILVEGQIVEIRSQ